MSKCITCSNPLSGRQKKFCSTSCKAKTNNNKYQDYEAQKRRGRLRKLELVKELGGCCERCGYCSNYAALCFHHVKGKDFKLDLRSLSNRKWETLLKEAKRCSLLCANCHMEEHYPDCLLE